MTNSVYTTITGAVLDQLDLWTNEVNSYAQFYTKHPVAAACARKRSEEARIAYFALSKVRDQLISDKLI